MRRNQKTESAGPWTDAHEQVFDRARFICGKLLEREGALRWFIAHELEDELGRCRMLLKDAAQLAAKDSAANRDLLDLVVSVFRTQATRFFKGGDGDPGLSASIESWSPANFTPWLSFEAYSQNLLAWDLGLTGAKRVHNVLGVLCSTLRTLGALAYNCASLSERLQHDLICHGEFASTVSLLLDLVAGLQPTLDAARNYFAIEEWNAQLNGKGGASWT